MVVTQDLRRDGDQEDDGVGTGNQGDGSGWTGGEEATVDVVTMVSEAVTTDSSKVVDEGVARSSKDKEIPDGAGKGKRELTKLVLT